ncbi:MAG: DUF115 domain-containing protein [Proteobacteria bacterium]|nr:DUF115 domain-containing protein [Pseudomonadota bacterium]
MAGLLSRIKKSLPVSTQDFVDRALGHVVDEKTWLKKTPISTLVYRKIRYLSAGAGYALQRNEQRFLRYKDRYLGRRAFVLGNGPSLNKCRLDLLDNEYTFGVNSIFLKNGFSPTFYVVEDTFVAEDRGVEICNLSRPTKFFGNYLEYCLQETPNTIWMNVCVQYHEYPGFPKFSKNAVRMLWVGGTVLYLCLQLAYYMGFSEVFLVGVDHDYVIPKDAEVSNVRESGADILSRSDDPNHFHPGYFGVGYRWHDPKVDRMEAAYRRAREVYEADGRTIYNATAGGKLEVFDRVAYEDLF